MASLEEMLYKAKTAAENAIDTAGKKTADFMEVGKLKMEASETEKDLAATLEGLGRLVYDGRKAGEDVSTMVEESIAKVDELNAKREEIRRKIDEYKNVVRCKQCGTVNVDDALYCKRCGNKLTENE